MTTLQEIQRIIEELAAELADPQWDSVVPSPGDSPDLPLLRSCGLDASATPIPLLHACRRRWAVPAGWRHRYCPICGAWPGFAEVCGVERSRYLRCVRCGAAWRAHALACTYCGMSEHAKLRSLIPEAGPPKWAIEACDACLGYLKVFTVLRPSAPEGVLSKDLETIELDLVAAERGYRRPHVSA